MYSGEVGRMNELSEPRTRKVLPIATVVTFLGFIDTNLLVPIITLYAAELGASIGIIGLVVGLYSLTNTVANILFGRLIDRIGYKIPMVAGLLGDALSMFLYSLSRLPVHLALVRAWHGITGAPLGPATMSVIANYSSETQKGKSMGYYGMAIGISTLAGFGLSGVLVSRLGYKAVFFVGSGLLLVGALLGLLLPGSRRRSLSDSRLSYGGGWKRAMTLFKRRGLIAGYSAIFAQYFTFGGVVTLLPLYVKTLGMEAFHVGMLMVAFAIMFVILQLPAGVLSDRLGRLGLTAAGLCIGIIALVLMPSMTTFPLLIVIMAVYGIAYGTIFPSVSAIVADLTVTEERGIATGMFHALLTAGVAIGAPVMGWVGGAVGVPQGLMLSAGIMVLALLVVLAVSRR